MRAVGSSATVTCATSPAASGRAPSAPRSSPRVAVVVKLPASTRSNWAIPLVPVVADCESVNAPLVDVTVTKAPLIT